MALTGSIAWPRPATAVLFDLDGTLADTAGDLGGALNRLRADRGLEPLPLDMLRPYASAGARGGASGGVDRLWQRLQHARWHLHS